jgi:hypothetical protein
VKDEAQIGIDKNAYNQFVVAQEEEQNRQDIREEELGLAVQEAARQVTEMHNIHRLQVSLKKHEDAAPHFPAKFSQIRSGIHAEN